MRALFPHLMNDTQYLQYTSAAARYPINQTNENGRIQLGYHHRQLVAINCTPDAGVVSCRFGSDSHTICKRKCDMSALYKTDERTREKSYASVSFYANELVLERCVRRQVHRRTPHGVVRRIQRDLYPQAWVSNYCPHFLIIDKHTHRVGRVPITKLRRTAHHENILPKPISA